MPDAPLWRALRLLLPHGWLRRRLIAAAHRRLVEELDKHAGRARSTLSERLAGTHRRFVDELSGHVEALIADIGAPRRRRVANRPAPKHEPPPIVNGSNA
ncbi:MAG: hypothetical protein IPG03_03700 [Candidatus Microthrix sp.]|nr:hypothetical protein [Candidatus Microthrix sp.]MBK6501488.1 hypothetical protein [Candidatus Microthrix sp.]